MANKGVHWPAEVVAALGTVPDSVIAKKVSVSGSAVAQKRRAMGIAAYFPEKAWTAADREELRRRAEAGETDYVIGAAMFRTERSVHHARQKIGLFKGRGGGSPLNVSALASLADDAMLRPEEPSE